jgi:hypothetical protein
LKKNSSVQIGMILLLTISFIYINFLPRSNVNAQSSTVYSTHVTASFFMNYTSLTDCFSKGRGEVLIDDCGIFDASVMMFDYEMDGDMDITKGSWLYLQENDSFNRVQFSTLWNDEHKLVSNPYSSPTHADFNHDGYEDMVCCGDHILRLFINTCAQHDNGSWFTMYELFNFSILTDGDFSPNPYGITSADFNDDGFIDVAVGYRINFKTSKIAIFYNQNGTNFIREDVFTLKNDEEEIGSIYELEAADFDQDDDIDFLLCYNTVRICKYDIRVHDQGVTCLLRNNGDTTFTNLSVIAVRGIPIVIGGEYVLLWRDLQRSLGICRINPKTAVADFDGDNDVDMILGDQSGKVELFENNGAGELTSLGKYYNGIIADFGAVSWGIDAADFDGDGDADFVVCGTNTNNPTENGIIYLKRNQLNFFN